MFAITGSTGAILDAVRWVVELDSDEDKQGRQVCGAFI